MAREMMDDQGNGTGRWHYTVENGKKIWPVGHCSPTEPCPECLKDPDKRYDFSHSKDDCVLCHGKRSVQRANPCPGHATAEEAETHYKEYLLDNTKFMGPKTEEWPKDKCAVKS